MTQYVSINRGLVNKDMQIFMNEYMKFTCRTVPSFFCRKTRFVLVGGIIETMAAHPSLCGGSVSSRRGLLASLWSIVVILTFMAFIVALIFTLSAKEERNNDEYYENEEQPEEEREASAEMAVTSRAMAFASLWTAVLATLMAIFGAVILGWQSPTGVYYTCCSAKVHKTTPLALGSFIGALLMFANLTLVCSVLFGEFEVRCHCCFWNDSCPLSLVLCFNCCRSDYGFLC
jgi:hypothetical protein